jgi:hypothetical protein
MSSHSAQCVQNVSKTYVGEEETDNTFVTFSFRLRVRSYGLFPFRINF